MMGGFPYRRGGIAIFRTAGRTGKDRVISGDEGRGGGGVIHIQTRKKEKKEIMGGK